MRFTCFRCGREYELAVSEEEFFQCSCGEKIDLEEVKAFEKIIEDIRDKEHLDEIQKQADEICMKIVGGEFSKVDMEIEREKLREKCAEYFPGKMYLFEMIYESRFKRLWEQFRSESDWPF